MYFKRLELTGFKSFANKTRLKFEPGVTAIVGPNGCGKSNIADAVKWVLGEQSAKELRGSRMEDVIFNGTSDKEPTNMAEVSIVLSNKDRVLPIDYEEIIITRRLFRSGESEYLINKMPVRLKDINDLLAGTGIGTSSYSIIEQGQIGQILSSKPEERRYIFEEASGITKFKIKKNEALRKLEHTENNLIRLNDIISEVERQMKSIERHAKKAEIYRQDFDVLKDLELGISSFQLKSINNELKAVSLENQDLKKTEEELLQSHSVLLENARLSKDAMWKAGEDLQKTQREITEIAASIDKNIHTVRLDKERIEELKAFSESSKEEIKILEEKFDIRKKDLEIYEKDLLSISSLEKDKENQLREKEKEMLLITKKIESCQAGIKTAKNDVVDTLSSQTKTKNELIKLGADIQNRKMRLRRLRIENENVLKEKESLHIKIKDVEVKFITAEKEFSSLKKRLNNLFDYKRKKEQLLLKMEMLRESVNKEERFDRSLGSIIKEAKKYIASVSNLIIIRPSFLRAAESLLKELTKVIVLDNGRIKIIEKEVSLVDSHLEEETLKEKDEDALRSKERDYAKINAEKLRLMDEIKRIDEEITVVNVEIEDVTSSLDNLTSRGEELNLTLNKKEEESAHTQGLIANFEKGIKENAALREETLLKIAGLKGELSSIKISYDNISSNLNMRQLEYSDIEKDIESKNNQIDLSLNKIEHFSNEIVHFDAERGVSEENKRLLESKLLDLADKKDTEIKAFNKKEAVLKEKEKELEVLRNNIRDLQIKLTEINYKRASLIERMQETYRVDLNGLDIEIGEKTDWDEVKEKIKQLKQKLEKMGPVNLVAIEEHKELEERFSFLTCQKEDLVNAKESLHKAIVKINATTRKLFIGTFQKIQVEFRSYFRMLFGGGHAEIFLLDERDILESGIEIVVRPPGKKLQNILLLSGGEKALTAISLLFAIFKINPSPFCVLDEIDAPLDESNIDRFTRVLQEFLKMSQFILITHSKKTIQMADILYGITMAQKGISKIVSVRLADKSEETNREEVMV